MFAFFSVLFKSNTAALSSGLLPVMKIGAFILESPWRRMSILLPCPSPPVIIFKLFASRDSEHRLIWKTGLHASQCCFPYALTGLKKNKIRFWTQSRPYVNAYRWFVRKCPFDKKYLENLGKNYLLHVNQASQSMWPVHTSKSSAVIYLLRALLARRRCMSNKPA